MIRTLLMLIACAALSSGCVPREATLPDHSIPHRVAQETTLVIWVRRPDGKFVEEEVKIEPGWWVASPWVVEVK